MSDQYLRRASLIVANVAQALDLSQMQFKFRVESADSQTPNTVFIRVYNLSAKTAQQIRNEYTRVILQGGYMEGAYGVLFDGTIKQIRRGRESAVDTYLDIFAADGDIAYNFGLVNSTMAAGATPSKQVAEITKNLAPQGVTEGYIPPTLDSAGGVLPRGKVLYGMARDYMRDIAASTLMSWSIQNGQLTMLPLTSYLPGEIVRLTSKTGMIGLPEQTDNGITIRSLLNPKIKIGGRVQIDNASIQRAAINLQYTAINLFANIANDGIYRVLVAEHEGDTRGNEWYTDMVCLAVDPTARSDDSVLLFG